LNGLRGFIGPIGDDIPSIFPIVAGVVLFLGTLVYANNALDARNAELNLRKAGLDLSYAVLEKGFLSTSDLGTVCSGSLVPTAGRFDAMFLVVLKDCGQRNSQNPFEGVGFCAAPDAVYSPQPPKSYVSLAYPIATDCGTEKGLGVVNVITWKKSSQAD
jgi:hypothetical protein